MLRFARLLTYTSQNKSMLDRVLGYHIKAPDDVPQIQVLVKSTQWLRRKCRQVSCCHGPMWLELRRAWQPDTSTLRPWHVPRRLLTKNEYLHQC
jgi:hypothetical protein